MHNKELEDRVLLRELVDRISMLGDKKDFERQVQLFAEDAVSETIANGCSILKLKGRKAMAEAFEIFLKEFETVFHFNGQQIVTINGDSASGICYCLITLIQNEAGKKIRTDIGASYQDEYIRKEDGWLLAKRIGRFEWQEIKK